MKKNFVLEIEYLLEQVPSEVWDDTKICGLMYDLLPWHEFSSIAIQTSDDDKHDPADWKYYDCTRSDCSRIKRELSRYKNDDGRFAYHQLLIESAEALLSIDFSKYGIPKTIDEFRLYKPFQLQIYDVDGTFEFNYCEYVLARRLD